MQQLLRCFLQINILWCVTPRLKASQLHMSKSPLLPGASPPCPTEALTAATHGTQHLHPRQGTHSAPKAGDLMGEPGEEHIFSGWG